MGTEATLTEDEMDIGNNCMVAAQGRDLMMLNPPTRLTRFSADEALVLAAWLVAMAQPHATTTFDSVLIRVLNT